MLMLVHAFILNMIQHKIKKKKTQKTTKTLQTRHNEGVILLHNDWPVNMLKTEYMCNKVDSKRTLHEMDAFYSFNTSGLQRMSII